MLDSHKAQHTPQDTSAIEEGMGARHVTGYGTTRTEETAHGTRRYITPDQLRSVKVGETWSLDYAARCIVFNPADTLVSFAGYSPEQRWWRWRREADGRVFTYTEEQCCRLIYVLIPRPNTPQRTAAAVAVALGRSPTEPGTARLAADLERGAK